jgi:hypothetical protein
MVETKRTYDAKAEQAKMKKRWMICMEMQRMKTKSKAKI